MNEFNNDSRADREVARDLEQMSAELHSSFIELDQALNRLKQYYGQERGRETQKVLRERMGRIEEFRTALKRHVIEPLYRLADATDKFNQGQIG